MRLYSKSTCTPAHHIRMHAHTFTNYIYIYTNIYTFVLVLLYSVDPHPPLLMRRQRTCYTGIIGNAAPGVSS